MEPTYPIFLFDNDESSFREFVQASDLQLYLEKPDILDGLYEAWDSTGNHFLVVWNEFEDHPELLLDIESTLGTFEDKIEVYEKDCTAKGLIFGDSTPRSYLCDPVYLRSKLRKIKGT